MGKSTVWVIQESVIPGSSGTPIDYAPAEQYGEVQFVLTLEPSKRDNSAINAQIFEQLMRMAMLFNESTDYLVLTGSPLAIFMTGMALTSFDKSPTILVWDRRAAVYRPVESNKWLTEVIASE